LVIFSLAAPVAEEGGWQVVLNKGADGRVGINVTREYPKWFMLGEGAILFQYTHSTVFYPYLSYYTHIKIYIKAEGRSGGTAAGF
jgi:hypothetical protein